MYSEYLCFDETNKKQYIYNDDWEIIQENDIGESFIDFIEIDFSFYEQFYNDLSKAYKIKSSTSLDGQSTKTEYIDLDYVSDFFKKYPLLRKIVVDKAIKNESVTNKTLNFANLDYSIFDIIFDNLSANHTHDFINSDYFMIYIKIELILKNIHSFNELTWSFIYDKNPYIPNLNEIKNNLFVKLMHNEDSDYSILGDLKFHILQKYYVEALIFCFDQEFSSILNKLNATERYYLFCNMNSSNHIDFYDVNTTFIINKKFSNKYDKFSNYNSKENFLSWSQDKLTAEMINNIKEDNSSIKQVYSTYKLGDIIYIEFQKMIECNIKIKKCKNCGKYFILKGDYSTDYCDRILPTEKYTCKRIGAINARRDKLESNPILKEYEKAYKRMYARNKNHKTTSEEFKSWVDTATLQRDLYNKRYESNPSQDIINEFKNFLGNK